MVVVVLAEAAGGASCKVGTVCFSLRTAAIFRDLKERVMITERMARDGAWLFRHRGILPLFLLIPGLWSLSHFQYLGGSHSVQHAWDWICLTVSLFGFLIRATTVGFVDNGTSGRNTACQLASELNTTGWYSIVRNPLYLGNFLITMGIIMVPADLSLIVITGCLFWIYYERIISAEEEFLSHKFGKAYSAWSRATPVFFPRLSGWVAPSRSFSLRMVLRREYCAVLLIGIAFLLLNFLEHLIAEQRYYVDVPWLIFFAGSLSIFLTLRTLKKKTTLLNPR
jgi:protein-S-isoprenylcysteine O-methyltransferase Ste14